MKIAIDAFRTVCEPQTSGAIYVAELAEALASLPQVDTVGLVVPNRVHPQAGLPQFTSPKIRWLRASSDADPSSGFLRQLWWVQRDFPKTALQALGQVDWLIGPYHQVPVFLNRRTQVLAVIHDLCGLRADCGYKKIGKGYWRHYLNFLTALVRADAIVTISNFTRVELLREFPSLSKRPMDVAYNAVTASRLSAQQASAALSTLDLPASFFLGFAAAGPRKGTDLTLKAYAEYRKGGGRAGMVLIGSVSGSRSWKQLAAELDVKEIVWVSGITDLVRDALYARAIALVFPSRCEGFGYPIVEAMRQGCPVVADRESPAAEIVQDSQTLLTELSVDAVMHSMSEIEELTSTARSSLADDLYHQSNQFNGAGLAASYLALMKSSAAT